MNTSHEQPAQRLDLCLEVGSDTLGCGVDVRSECAHRSDAKLLEGRRQLREEKLEAATRLDRRQHHRCRLLVRLCAATAADGVDGHGASTLFNGYMAAMSCFSANLNEVFPNRR